MRRKHEFICINCPLSCTVELFEEDGEVLEVRGNECAVGEKYAVTEFRDPRRRVTTTVRVRGGVLPVVPVATASPVPKRLVREVVRVLASVELEAPVEMGQVVMPDVLGTGVDVIATRPLPSARKGRG
jgi:CxxC motif-containing protein